MRRVLLATTMLVVASSAHAVSNFTVSASGGFVDLNGQPFSVHGVSMRPDNADWIFQRDCSNARHQRGSLER